MQERRVTRGEMLQDPNLGPAERALFEAALARGESLWYGAEGWVIRDRQHNRRPLPQPAVVEVRKAAGEERRVPKHFRPKRRRR